MCRLEGIIRKYLRAFFKNNKGITLLEIMISISILGICMAYIAYDSSFSAKAIYQMNEKDKMLYAAQESIERYKSGLISDKINGYSIEVKDSEEVPGVPNLKKLTITVKPINSNSGIGDLIIVNYVFSSTDAVPGETTNLTASPSADNITLNWTRAVNASTYSVKRKAEGDTAFEIIAGGITEDAYTDTDVEEGIRYYYIVWAVNDNGKGPESNEANAIIIINNTGLEPVADSYTQGGFPYYWYNYGTENNLLAQNGNKSNKKYKSYLKFNLAEIQGTIISAKLRIYGSANHTVNSETFAVADDEWTETGITWSNAPAESSSLGYLAFSGTSRYVELDVSSYCKAEMAGNQIASFVFTSPDNTQITAVSRHPSSNRPQLLITWTPSTVPPAPQNLTAEPGDAKVMLAWNTVIGAESYNVKRSTTPGGPYSTVSSPSQTSFTDSTVTNGTTYYYVVTAVNSTGESNNSNEARATPDKISTIKISPAADAYVRDGVFSTTNYGTNAKLEVKNAAVGSDERRISYLRFDISGLTGEIISADLRLYGSNTDDSEIVNVGLYEVNDYDWDENSLTLDNAEPAGTEIGTVKVDNTQSYKQIDISQYVKSAMTGTKIISVAYAGKDASRLLSFNSKESISNKPELVIVKTVPKPAVPKNLTAVPGNAAVTLNWNRVPGADSYRVKRGTADGGPYSVIASGITDASYTDSSVTNGVMYYYVVSAVNTSGEGPDSNQVSVTPNEITTIKLNPQADAKVESANPSTNYGGSTSFEAGITGIFFTNTRRSYLRFDLTGYTHNTPIQAKLRIYGKTDGNTIGVNAYKVSDITWKETGSGSIKWNNMPAMEAQVGNVSVGAAQQYYEIDVTEYIAQQIDSSPLISIGLSESGSATGLATFNSREAGSSKPELVVDMIVGVPKVPQNVMGIGSDGKAAISWDAAGGAESYKVKGSTTKGGPYTIKAEGITGTTFEETGLTNDTAYYYVVNAVNSKGESANSAEVCVIPSEGETSIILYPSADAYIRDGQYADNNYGKFENLDVNYTPLRSGRSYQTYLMYDLSGLKSTPKTADLIITGKNITNNKTMEIDIYKVTDDTWKEDSITWNNSPNCGWTHETFYVNNVYKASVVDILTFAKEEYKGNKILSVLLDAYTTKCTASFSSREGADIPLLKVTY